MKNIEKGESPIDEITVTATIDRATYSRLKTMVGQGASTESELVAEAIRRYVEDYLRQTEAIREGISQADEGKFASDERVEATDVRILTRVSSGCGTKKTHFEHRIFASNHVFQLGNNSHCPGIDASLCGLFYWR